MILLRKLQRGVLKRLHSKAQDPTQYKEFRLLQTLFWAALPRFAF